MRSISVLFFRSCHFTGEWTEYTLGKPQQSNLETQQALIEICSLRRLFEKGCLCASGHTNSIMQSYNHLAVIVSSLSLSLDNVLTKQRSFIFYFFPKKNHTKNAGITNTGIVPQPFWHWVESFNFHIKGTPGNLHKTEKRCSIAPIWSKRQGGRKRVAKND